MEALRLILCGGNLTCKVPNKCLNVRERLEISKWNKTLSRPFSYSPVSRHCPWKKPWLKKIMKMKILKKSIVHSIKHPWWNFLALIVKNFLVWTIFVKKLHRSCLRGSKYASKTNFVVSLKAHSDNSSKRHPN